MIYFIQAGPIGPVKVGYTKCEPKERLRSLQTGSAFKLRLVGYCEGTKNGEAVLHRMFRSLRMEGEWFRFHIGTMKIIYELCGFKLVRPVLGKYNANNIREALNAI